MRLRSGKIIHMANEVSNVNGGSSTNDSLPVIVQQANVTSRSEGAIGSESIAVTTVQTRNVRRNIRPRGTLPPFHPLLTAGWPPFGLPPWYTPPVGSFVPPVRFGSVNGGDNSQNPQQHFEYSRDYNVGSISNAANSMNARNRCYVSLPESKEVKIATMGLGFYMRRKLLNVHIPDLANLAEKIFDMFLRDKQLILPEGRSLLSVKDLKGKPYCKFYQATSHSTNSCVRFRDLIQEAIMEGWLKFNDGNKEIKVDVGPFDVDAIFVEPCFRVNMVGMSYYFDVALDDFESQVRSVYPRVGDGLLDFLVQQKIKDWDISLCPWCNAVFDAEATIIFEKKRTKKELAHREE
ncbi:hypothetical protein Ahy_A03g014084 [Arachis hypogaea]|uniref:Uncharacterized protein n=1 Tax=Arachis hypogaea TaxID=3818 RepID=A0A445DWW7_ARAHY|nr:hypothetical protein Ahy_A03g014084 [Arachis hypogaea]